MSLGNTGMRISVRGASFSGQQIVKLDNAYARDEVFILNDGVITSHIYDPTEEAGFSQSNSANELYEALEGVVLDDDVIVEIAGGKSIKVRYSSGLCVIAVRTYGGSFVTTTKTDIARVTMHNEYAVAENKEYYKSGGGTSPLIPMLEGGGGSGIVAVFEGVESDSIVTIDDVSGSNPVVGFVAGLTVTASGGNFTLHTPDGEVSISDFGTIARDTIATRDIRMSSKINTGGNIAVNYSDQFSSSHYAYIQSHREDYITGWAGVGNVGYVVDLGETAYMKVMITGNSATVGGDGTVVSPSLTDTVPFVVQGGAFKRVNSDGTLETLGVTSLDGLALVSFIYSHNMEDYISYSTEAKETEPFCITGYTFGYGAGHLVDATLENL